MYLKPEWAACDTHRAALETVCRDADADEDVIGVLVCGSVARGDAMPISDLDVRLLLAANASPRLFDAREVEGIFVERTYRTTNAARERLQSHPMEVYPYREGRILRDATGDFALLRDHAQAIFDAYIAPHAEKRDMAGWLQSTQRKLAAAHHAGAWEKAAFVGATSAWPILTGLWLAADRPLPPSGAVLANLPDAAQRVGLDEHMVCAMWQAETMKGRVSAALHVLSVVLPLLGSAAG